MKKLDYIIDRYERLFTAYQNHIVFLEELLERKYYGDLRKEIAELERPIPSSTDEQREQLKILKRREYQRKYYARRKAAKK